MDIDDSFTLVSAEVQKSLFPLREMADRVGREVERFAEALDRWTPGLGLTVVDPGRQRTSALAMVEDWNICAADTTAKLSAQHRVELTDRFWHRFSNRLSKEPRAADPRSGSDGSAHGRTTVADLEVWNAEAHTWMLVNGLLRSSDRNYYPDLVEPDSNAQLDASSVDRFFMDGTSWRNFLVNNNLARERVVILKWLELAAEQTSEDIDLIQQEMETAAERGPGLWSQGWLETRERIKGEKRLRLWNAPIESELPAIKRSSGDDLLVTQLDLDAQTRQGRAIEQADEAYDQCTWEMLWQAFRRGQSLHRVGQWLVEHGQYARAACLGVDLSQSEAVTQDDTTSIARHRWRHACRQTAERGGVSDHERAVFGLLGGHLGSVERLCRNWEDRLFAQYNALVLQQYSAWLSDTHPGLTLSKQPPGSEPTHVSAFNDDLVSSAQQVIATVGKPVTSSLRAQHPFSRIQAALAGHGLEALVRQEGINLSRKTLDPSLRSISQLVPGDLAEKFPDDEASELLTDDFSALRVLTHVLMISGQLGYDFKDDDSRNAKENVIAAYIDYLRQAGKMGLIPTYAAKLSKERAEITLARILPSITHDAERQEYIKLLMSSNFDIFEILINQYEFAMEYSSLTDESAADLEMFDILEQTSDSIWPGTRVKMRERRPLDDDEEIIVRSMEWLLLLEGHWSTTFETLADVAVRFLGMSSRVRARLTSHLTNLQSRATSMLPSSFSPEYLSALSPRQRRQESSANRSTS